MRISKMAKVIEPSLTRKLFDMAGGYPDVIDLTLGDPDFRTPARIRRAACEAIMDGRTKYSANAGLPELRKIVSARIGRETGVWYDPGTEVQITVGAMEAIYLALCCLIDPGDEVVIPSPHWVNYRHMAMLVGGVPVLVDADEEHDFVVAVDSILDSITERTRAIIINSPNNPTGTVYDGATLEAISRVAVEHDITVIFDECYKSILYDGAKFTSILDFPGMKEHAVVINSCSKQYAMTGWRLGYAAGPADLIANMPKLQENIAACAPLPSQYAAIAALSGSDEETEAMRNGYEKRRNILLEEISKNGRLSCTPPKGTFYALVNLKKNGMKSEEFAYALLKSAHVAVVPGITYGNACEGYVRIAYTLTEERLREGLKRMGEFADSL